MPDETPTMPSVELVQQIAAGIDGVTTEQVGLVLAGLAAAQSGEPLGTIRRDPSTGEVAHRIDRNGVHQWRISKGGDTWYDLTPALPGWDLLYMPSL